MFIKEIRKNKTITTPEDAYLNEIPAIAAMEELKLERPVSFFIGENGSGKSTLLEAVAVCYGFNAEGGSRNFNFTTAATHSGLHQYLTLVKAVKRPQDGFFLRAESFYNAASYIEQIDYDGTLLASYGGKHLHAQSHGEGFLALVLNRFGGNGFYILDEPESALSPARQLTLLRCIYDLVRRGSQFLIATHSPILMAYPDAQLFLLNENGISQAEYKQTEHYQITRRFLDNPERMLSTLFSDE